MSGQSTSEDMKSKGHALRVHTATDKVAEVKAKLKKGLEKEIEELRKKVEELEKRDTQ